MPPTGKTQRRFFHRVCGDVRQMLLLSPHIDSKDDLKSLLLVDSALRITALGDTVTIQALSDTLSLYRYWIPPLPAYGERKSRSPVAFYAFRPSAHY